MATRAGVGQSPAYSTIVLRPAAGNLALKVRHRKEVVVNGVWDAGEQMPTRDVARRHRMWSRGAGYSSRPGGLEVGEEWDALAESENACYRFGYICPSGEQTAIAITAAWGPPRKLISFNADLWCIFENRLAYFDGGAGAIVDYYNNSGDLFTDAEVWNGSLRVALLCTHTNPNQHAFVTVTPSGAGYAAALNPTPAAPGATAMSATTPQTRLLQTAFWEYEGVSATRLLGQVSDYEIQWMITPTGDPYDALNWGTEVQIGDQTHQIRRLVSSHDTLWVAKADGVYAVNDKNASDGGENITPYWSEQLPATSVSGSDSRVITHWFGGYLVASNSLGLELIDVQSWQQKDRPKPIHISYGRPNNTVLSGYTTGLCTDSGWLVNAIFCLDRQARVLYGTPRTRESPVAGVTEFDWFAEVGPFSGDRGINAMVVNTDSNGRPNLWLAFADQSNNPSLVKVELFLGTSPIADPNHRYATTASATFTDEHWAARAATKGALRGELSVQNCGGGRKVDLYAVAGAGVAFPGTANASVTTNVETSTFPLTSVRGSVIRSKAVLTSTATVPAVIHEWGMKSNLGFPLRRRGTWLVEVSDATEGDLPSFETPSTVEAALKTLCETVEAFTVLDDEGTTMTCVLDNVLPWRREDTPMNDLGIHQKVRLLEVSYQEVPA